MILPPPFFPPILSPYSFSLTLARALIDVTFFPSLPQAIVGGEGGVKHRSRPFHKLCFTCEECGTLLADVRFRFLLSRRDIICMVKVIRRKYIVFLGSHTCICREKSQNFRIVRPIHLQ